MERIAACRAVESARKLTPSWEEGDRASSVGGCGLEEELRWGGGLVGDGDGDLGLLLP